MRLIDADKLDMTTEVRGLELSIVGCEIAETIVRNAQTITEEEIVRPYIEKLKAKMQERDEDNGGEPLNAVDRGYHLACEHLFKEIDSLLTEKGSEE